MCPHENHPIRSRDTLRHNVSILLSYHSLTTRSLLQTVHAVPLFSTWNVQTSEKSHNICSGEVGSGNLKRVHPALLWLTPNVLVQHTSIMCCPMTIMHSLIICWEVLILTLSIFNALYGCISWYSLATGLISEDIIHRDHIIQYSPCALGSVQRNTSLGTVFPRTLPWANIGNTSSRGKH